MSRYLAEFVGTFVLVFAGCGSAVLAGDKIGFLGVSLAFGLALLAMAYTVGHVSGCHINPAVTLGLFITKKMERRYLLGYWAAQVLGAIVAAACLLAIAKGTPNGYDAAALGFAANGYDVHSPGHYGVLFFTMLAALLPAQARNAKPNMVRIFKEMVAFIWACCHHEVRTPHTREPFKFVLPFTIGFSLLVSPLFAQPTGASKPTPDTLILTDGEKLIGQFLHSTGSSLVFKSDAAGEVTIDWNKVQDLQSTNQFAIIEKGVQLRNKQDIGAVPQGNLSVANQQLQITAQPPGTPQSVPFSNAAYVLDQATFRKNLLSSPGFFSGWGGNVSAGASLVQATQSSRSFTSAISLVRVLPGEKWLTPRYRTAVAFLASYGKVTDPNTPTIKTSIFHADIEQDKYLNPRLYVFGSGAWDHNFSQGLDLQQTYGGGLGWTAYKTDTAELDFRASMNYIRQQFTNSAFNQSLIGSTFGESYIQKFSRGINLTEALSITPAWNNLNAYSALGSVTLGLPLYKRFDLTLGIVDSFLNNPPPTFRKNSFQFITALTYTLP